MIWVLPLPAVLVGDLNSSAAGTRAPGTSYAHLLDAGYIDIWTQANRDEPGLTADHPKDLRSDTLELNRRIDLILLRPVSTRFFY